MQVIQPQAKQDCSRCRHIYKCRNRRTANDKPLSDRNDTINLLVCRLKLGINRDSSTRTLLQLFRPGMVNLVASSKRRAADVNVDFDNMLMEMQSFAIESILTKYRIGELNPITNFFFDRRNGYLVKWAQWYVTKHRRFQNRHVLAGTNPFSEFDDSGEFEYVGDDDTAVVGHNGSNDFNIVEETVDANLDGAERTIVDDVMEIIDDGVSLNANEYRVFKFCLQNANDNNDIRMIDGLHIIMSRIMNVSRPRITRLYKRARDKVIAAKRLRSLNNEQD